MRSMGLDALWLWLVVLVNLRVSQYQTVTLLEVSRLAYAACLLIACAASWKELHSSTLEFIIHCSREVIPHCSGLEKSVCFHKTSFRGWNLLQRYVMCCSCSAGWQMESYKQAGILLEQDK